MSTRCRTHQAESSSIGGLDLHAFDRFPPQRLGGQFPPPSGCRAFSFMRGASRSPSLRPGDALPRLRHREYETERLVRRARRSCGHECSCEFFERWLAFHIRIGLKTPSQRAAWRPTKTELMPDDRFGKRDHESNCAAILSVGFSQVVAYRRAGIGRLVPYHSAAAD
jgi:hypothetical protein